MSETQIQPGSGQPTTPRPLPPPTGDVLTGTPGDDVYLFLVLDVPFRGLTIRDPGGLDGFSAAGLAGPHVLDLRPGATSTVGANQLTLDASSRIEMALGGSDADLLVGDELANWLEGGAGNDTLQGGAGIDTALYSGRWAGGEGYAVTRGAAGLTVADRSGTGDGTDTLQGVERLAFGDVTLAFDLDGPAGMAYRLYQAALLRPADAQGLGYHVRSLESGLGPADVAAQFVASAEFAGLYGALDDAAFVSQLYRNALGREADSEGLAYHLGRLQAGTHSRADILVGFAESPEHQARLLGVMEVGMTFVPL